MKKVLLTIILIAFAFHFVMGTSAAAPIYTIHSQTQITNTDNIVTSVTTTTTFSPWSSSTASTFRVTSTSIHTTTSPIETETHTITSGNTVTVLTVTAYHVTMTSYLTIHETIYAPSGTLTVTKTFHTMVLDVTTTSTTLTTTTNITKNIIYTVYTSFSSQTVLTVVTTSVTATVTESVTITTTTVASPSSNITTVYYGGTIYAVTIITETITHSVFHTTCYSKIITSALVTRLEMTFYVNTVTTITSNPAAGFTVYFVPLIALIFQLMIYGLVFEILLAAYCFVTRGRGSSSEKCLEYVKKALIITVLISSLSGMILFITAGAGV